MDPAQLSIKTLKGLSKNELARLVLKLTDAAVEKDRVIEEHEAWKLEVVQVLTQIADNAEQMKLKANEYSLTKKDPIAQKINEQINWIVLIQIATFHRLVGLLHNMKPGSEKSTLKGKRKFPAKESAGNGKGNNKPEEKDRKKSRYYDIPVENLKCLVNALAKVDLKAPVDEVIDKIQQILRDSKPPFESSEPNTKNKGRRSNKDKLEKEEFEFTELPPATACPGCGEMAFKKSFYDWLLKTQRVVMKQNQGITTPVAITNYYCPHCDKFHTVLQGNDYPIAPTRTIGLKPIVQSFHLHYLGLALNRAGASFEKGAHLGSDTINRNSFEWARIYILPLYEALLRRIKELEILVADETTFNVTHPMGYGKKPKQDEDKDKDKENTGSEATCSQTYVLSFGTSFRSFVQLHAYALMEGRGGEEMAKILDASYKFLVLITDAYQGYDKVLENHPDSLHQVCLIHFRRHLIRGAWGEQAARDFMALDDEAQVAVMERAKKEDTIFYKVARVFQIVSYIYGWEGEIAKARGDPAKLAEIRKKQTALMDSMDTLMLELSEGKITQSKKGGKWSAAIKDDPLAEACTFYRNNRENFRHFLKEDNFEITPDSSVVEQDIRPLALVRNNSHFFTNADYARMSLAVFSLLCKGLHKKPYVM